MLEVLCGNKNVQRILIFLFVNNRCYGTQLHRSLKVPLTPIQKALNRLENGGLITSFYEGKTRLYQFNPAYPLMPEVENLLKRPILYCLHTRKRIIM
jgi:predicted transcriptional regulator